MVHAPLHNHSEYSALDGLSRMSEIADRCIEIGCECCGLTDHGVISGHMEFSKVLTEKGIKPIFGCELYHGVKSEWGPRERDQAHLVALAMTDEGLRNLWRLVDYASSNFRFVGRVDHDALKKYREGLVLTSACIQGLVPQGALEGDTEHLNRYLDTFGDDFYIELHTYPGPDIEEVNWAQVEIGQERGLQFVYADDAHRARKDQYPEHDMYVARSTGDSIYTPVEKRKMWHPEDSLYIRDESEIRKALSYLPDSVVDNALENTARIAERADASLPEVRRHLPVYSPSESAWRDEPEDKTSDGLLIDLVEEGLERRYGADYPEEIFDRAQKELEVFIDADLCDYLLWAWDVGAFCDDAGIIRGPGRGSAAGCLVAYALGITDVDPLRYDLIFERFYNAGREEGLPDIDSDFPREHRKTVREYLEGKLGKDRVRTIGTVKRLKPVEALNITHNACGVTFKEKEAVKEIVQKTPDLEILGTDSIGWDEHSDPGKTVYVMDHCGDEIEEYIDSLEPDRMGVVLDWIFLVSAICSRVEGYGVHPSGIVISDEDLPGSLPCFYSRGQNIQATNFPMSVVEALQYVKLDILGLRTLDTLGKWGEYTDDPPNWSGLEVEYEDHECWDLLEKGLSQGIFQVEDGYARRIAKDFRPRNVEDLGVIVALNRPGPIRSGAPDSFVLRRNGGEDDLFDGREIPLLEPILRETYGWFIYQEQVIQFFNVVGYNLFEADAVRSILGKKKPEKMRELRDGKGPWEGRGYYEMMKAAGLSDMAEELWGVLEDFAKYSFNKSHSIAYAILGWRCLYAKWSDPQAFFMACIETNKEKAGAYIAEARRMLINVVPPDIDRSMWRSTKEGSDIRLGFGDIKGVRASGKYVVELRDELGYDEIQSPEILWEILEVEGRKWKSKKDKMALDGKAYKAKSPRQELGSDKLSAMYDAGCWDARREREDITLDRKQELEAELLGVILTDQTEEAFAANEDAISECDRYDDLYSDEELDYYKLPGVITMIVEKKTKAKGEAMAIVTMEWEGDDIEFVVFPKQWKSYKFLWKERTPAILKLRKTDRGVNFEEGIRLSA